MTKVSFDLQFRTTRSQRRRYYREETDIGPGFWGMAAMTAAETNFPNPPPDQPQWLALAQAVYNRQADPQRHDDVCGGGMRWQIFWNTGYDYKNTISNGIFINLGARLAVYTGNHSYTDWIEPTWKWLTDMGIMDSNYTIYDGIQVENCSAVDSLQFSYNTAVFLLTAATMYNYVSEKKNLVITFSRNILSKSRKVNCKSIYSLTLNYR